MPNDLTLYTNPMSRGRIARWMLEETGAPYGVEVLSFDDSIRSAPYRAINPMAEVPSIRHGDVVVTETAAICAYLADAFPDAGLAPPAEGALEANTHIAGEAFSAADVYVGANLNWGVKMTQTIDARPAFTRYLDLLVERAAFTRASGLDDALAATLA